jgi:hypothetical protein
MAGDTRVYWLPPTAAIFISIVVLIVVAIVQYAHLRIANQSVVIDLYERRMSAYAQIDKSVQSVMNKGEATHDDLYQFVKRFVSFFDTSSELFAPYLCLDQKHTPFWRPW